MDEDPVAKVCVDIVHPELSAFVQMAKCVPKEADNGAKDLKRDVPSTFDNLSKESQWDC